jgi:hypothetical protein
MAGMSEIRLIRLTLSFCAEQQRLIDCVAEFDGGGEIAAKVGNGDDIGSANARRQKMSLRGEGKIHNTVIMPKIGNTLEIDEWSNRGVGNGDFCRRDLVGFTGIVSHGVFSGAAPHCNQRAT